MPKAVWLIITREIVRGRTVKGQSSLLPSLAPNKGTDHRSVLKQTSKYPSEYPFEGGLLYPFDGVILSLSRTFVC